MNNVNMMNNNNSNINKNSSEINDLQKENNLENYNFNDSSDLSEENEIKEKQQNNTINKNFKKNPLKIIISHNITHLNYLIKKYIIIHYPIQILILILK